MSSGSTGKWGGKGKKSIEVDLASMTENPGPDETHEQLVRRVKLCQKDDHLKTKWWSFCEVVGNGVRDPNRHDESFIRTFFMSLNNGDIPEYGGHGLEPNKIFVGGLPRTATPESISQYFSMFGEIGTVDMKYDADGSFRGFGFIVFKNTESVELVLRNKANIVFEGKWVDCKPAERPRPSDPLAVDGIARTGATGPAAALQPPQGMLADGCTIPAASIVGVGGANLAAGIVAAGGAYPTAGILADASTFGLGSGFLGSTALALLGGNVGLLGVNAGLASFGIMN